MYVSFIPTFVLPWFPSYVYALKYYVFQYMYIDAERHQHIYVSALKHMRLSRIGTVYSVLTML